MKNAREVKGRIEKAAGELTGNEKLKQKGNKDIFMGKVDRVADKAIGRKPEDSKPF